MSDSDKAKMHYEIGREREEEKRWDEAIEEYNKATELNPNYIDAHYRIGRVYHKKGDKYLAIENYNTVTGLDKKHAKAYFYRGEARGLSNKAIEDFKDFIKLKPNCTGVYLTIGKIHVELKQWKEALPFLKSFFASNPPNNDNRVDAHFYKGKAQVGLKEWDEAIKDFDKALDLDSDYIYKYKKADVSYHSDGDIIHHSKGAIYHLKGQAYYGKGDTLKTTKNDEAKEYYKQAIKDYNKALELDNNSNIDHNMMRQIYPGQRAEIDKIERKRNAEFCLRLASYYEDKSYAYYALGEKDKASEANKQAEIYKKTSETHLSGRYPL